MKLAICSVTKLIKTLKIPSVSFIVSSSDTKLTLKKLFVSLCPWRSSPSNSSFHTPVPKRPHHIAVMSSNHNTSSLKTFSREKQMFLPPNPWFRDRTRAFKMYLFQVIKRFSSQCKSMMLSDTNTANIKKTQMQTIQSLTFGFKKTKRYYIKKKKKKIKQKCKNNKKA